MADKTAPVEVLIQSNKADAMRVLSREGDRIGHLHAYMLHKRSGRAAYAILSIGGFLGMGKAFYPLPFHLLDYDPVADDYRVTIDRRLLEGGPSWANTAPLFDQAYADRVASYYGVEREDLRLG
jgi:hypothetical protein